MSGNKLNLWIGLFLLRRGQIRSFLSPGHIGLGSYVKIHRKFVFIWSFFVSIVNDTVAWWSEQGTSGPEVVGSNLGEGKLFNLDD